MAPTPLDLTLHIERRFPASRERVFAALTKQEQLRRWWGPRGFRVPHLDVDLRTGGRYRIAMRPPEGPVFHVTGTFLELAPPGRLAYTFRWEEPDPDDRETVVEISLDRWVEATVITVTQGSFATQARLELHSAGMVGVPRPTRRGVARRWLMSRVGTRPDGESAGGRGGPPAALRRARRRRCGVGLADRAPTGRTASMTRDRPPPPRGIGEVLVSSRPYDEYLAMFGLTDAEVLVGPVLDCPGGAGGFAAGVRARGGSATSADPVYDRDPDRVVAESRAGFERGLHYLDRNRDAYVWTWFRDVEDLVARRGAGLDAFAADFRGADARYVAAGLPGLPFADGAFRLVLSGYLLFTYPDHFDLGWHHAALAELARVGGEVRVYPLVDTTYVRYPGLDALRRRLEDTGHASEVRRVAYEFQRGANEVLVIAPAD